MSQTNSMQSDEQSGVSHSDSAGRRLRALRQSRGLDIERIAAQLHLERRIVEALEQDRYDLLPSPVFVVGYFRNYARLLGVDPAPIVDAYRAQMPADETVTSRAPATPLRQPARSSNRWVWIIALPLLGLAAALFGVWWQGGMDLGLSSTSIGTTKQDQTTPGTMEQTEPADLTEDDRALSDTEQETPSSAPIDSFGSTVQVPAEAIPLRRPEAPPATPNPDTEQPAADVGTTPPTIPTSTPPSEPAAPEPPKEVVLSFTGTSWVDVRDANGEVVLNGEMRAGDRRVLTGKAPYKLVVGNAAATQLTIGGEAYNLQRHSQGNVARFSLDPQAPE